MPGGQIFKFSAVVENVQVTGGTRTFGLLKTTKIDVSSCLPGLIMWQKVKQFTYCPDLAFALVARLRVYHITSQEGTKTLTPEAHDLRRFERVEIEKGAGPHLESLTGEWFGAVRSLSAAGMLLQTHRTLNLDSEWRLRFLYPDESVDTTVTVRVIYLIPSGTGLRFEFPSKDALEQIERVIEIMKARTQKAN